MATCFSSEYQFPAPVLQPTLRLPIASMFFSVVGLGAFLSGLDGGAGSSGAEAGGAVCVAGALWVWGELGELCVGYPCAAAEPEATSRARANTPNCLNENCIFTPLGIKSRASSASPRGPAILFQLNTGTHHEFPSRIYSTPVDPTNIRLLEADQPHLVSPSGQPKFRQFSSLRRDHDEPLFISLYDRAPTSKAGGRRCTKLTNCIAMTCQLTPARLIGYRGLRSALIPVPNMLD